MARRPRISATGLPHHVVNRGNDRRCIFEEYRDYLAFLTLLREAKVRYPVKIYGVCLMPNHFHAVLQPDADGALSAYVQWVTSRYACYLRGATGTAGLGHVFQRRFWSDVITTDLHFVAVLRYVEANAHRAKLVARARDWAWGSLVLRERGDALLDALPCALPSDWLALVDQEQSREELERLRPTGQARSALAAP